MSYFYLITLALLPGLLIAVYLYLHDKHEPEPLWLVIGTFLLGAVSFLVSLLVAWPVDMLIPLDDHDLTAQAIHAFAVIALIEELSKFLFLRVFIYPNRNFNEPLDGIIYAVMIGMGFATAENVLYVWKGGLDTAFVRMFSAIPAHAMFSVMMGYWMGRAKFIHAYEARYALMGLFSAVILHGLYDYFLFISFVPGIWIWSFITLAIGILLGKRAIEIHQHASPFTETRKASQH
jgi:RsiW-degrading membrane proteinase PrsW (M82 family)